MKDLETLNGGVASTPEARRDPRSDCPRNGIDAPSPKSYWLSDPSIRFKPSRLDSSDYPGQIVWRKSCQESGAGGSAQRPPVPDSQGLSKSHISASLGKRSASIEFYRGASFLKVQVEKDREISAPPKIRGEVTEFTASARRRMLDFMAKIDGSLFRSLSP